MIVHDGPFTATVDPAITSDLSTGTRMYIDPADGLAKVAAATSRAAGTLSNKYVVANAGGKATLIPLNLGGTRKFLASGVIAANGHFSFAANGKIQAEATPANAKGQLRSRGATADNDIVEGFLFND